MVYEKQSASKHDRCLPCVQPLFDILGQGRYLDIGLPEATLTTQSRVGGDTQSFQVGLVVYMLPVAPRTLATGDSNLKM